MNGAKRHSIYLAAILVMLLTSADLRAQTPDSRMVSFEEIIVKFEVPRLINRDIFAQYDGSDIFLPMLEIFRLLEINVRTDFENGKFTGEYLTLDNDYEIDLNKLKAKCYGKTTELKRTDYYLTETELYLRLELFETIFNLKMNFNFSQLSVYLPLSKTFPAYLKLKRRAEHEKLLAQEVSAKDVEKIPYHREHLKAGVADWMVTVNPLEKKGQYFGLGLGGMLFGGDMTINGTANSGTGIESDQMRYKWHYVFDENKFLTQFEAGEITAGGTLLRRLDGAMVTNKPQVQRKYFQTVNVEGFAGEGWEVELYINNRLEDFAYTDGNGNYNFLTDVNYGSSQILIKMYGPNGEIKTKEEYVRAPYNLIPKHEFEYTVAGGVESNAIADKKYTQANAYFGVFSGLTLGVNSDFPIKPIDDEQPTYAAEATFHPFGSLLLSGSFSPDNTLKGNLNYSKPSLVNINAGYVKYYENAYWNKMNQLDNISVAVSSPLKIKNQYLSLRFRYTSDRYPLYKIVNMNYGFKLPLYKIHLSYIGNYKISDFVNRTDKRITSQLFASTSFLRWFRPQFKIDYEHDINDISKYGVYLQKRIFRTGQLSFSFERNQLTKSNSFMISFSIFNSFANFTSRANIAEERTVITQTQKGSIRFDQDAGRFLFDRRNGLGLGAAVIWPFLDENYNGVRDEGEELLPELKANVGGARGKRTSRKSLYYYDGLRPYDEYLVQIDQYSLDNPTLQPAHENFSVLINPNMVTSISVPVVTAGEINGQVVRVAGDESAGVGGIKVKVINELTGKEVNITTFNNGEYFYLGMVPGMYRALPDPDQLSEYGYISDPPYVTFQVKTVEGGDVIENLNFRIIPKQ